MQPEATLRLVKDERLQDDPIPLERRYAHRRPISGRVTAVVKIGEGEKARNRICSLMLQDMSDGGVGAATDEGLPAGAAITVFVPPHGPERGFDATGKIAWCRREDDQHLVGIQLDRQQTACA